MMATGRLATPSKVHQLWDAISVNGSNQVMDFDKLVSGVTSMHEIHRDEVIRELDFATKDGLILKKAVETQNHEETEIYKLPDASKVEKVDHDWYCFQCDLGGSLPVVKCKDCPRIYHLECLPEDRQPEKDLFVCPACHIKSTKPSADKVIVKPEVLNQLLQYICNRCESLGAEILGKADGKTWALAANRTIEEAWRFSFLVHMPMDLQTMMSKANEAKYTSLEEFQIDCETLVHALGVYFGVGAVEISQEFLRVALHDIQEIKLCHDCFQRSNEKNHDWWFCLPCSTPHEVVWAKQKGYCYWPAKVMKKDGNKYDVRYFGGDYERGIIDAKYIQPIQTPISQLKVRRTALWNDAFDELTKFQEIAKDPELAQKLPPKGGKGAPSAAQTKDESKGGTTQTPEAVLTKKRRNSASTAKSSRKSGAFEKAMPTPQSNVTATTLASPAGRKKAGASSKYTSAPVTESPTKPVEISVSLKEEKQVYSDLSSSNLDPDVIAFLNEVDESLEVEACFAGEVSNESVTEDAVSSTCNESKSTSQAVHRGLFREKLIKKFMDLQDRHKSELSRAKKKQWCSNCEREAIYACCWNSAYCSKECQITHWRMEHRHKCRRQTPPPPSGVISAVVSEKTHSVRIEEQLAFSHWINEQLGDDPDLKHLLPIDREGKSLYEKVKDGILLCKLINNSCPGTVDERAINKNNLTLYATYENLTLALNSAQYIGCNIANIDAIDLTSGKPHLVLDLFWQIIRIGLFSQINLKHCAGLANLLQPGEKIEDMSTLPPEAILLRWLNYHLCKAQSVRKCTNFSSDIQDGEIYTVLLGKIAPKESGVCMKVALQEGDPLKRAGLILQQTDKLDCRSFVTPQDIVKGVHKLNLAFVANLFNKFPGFDEPDSAELSQMLKDIEEYREEKTQRNWINSVLNLSYNKGSGGPSHVNWLHSDLADDLMIFQLYDIINPGIVDWNRVYTNRKFMSRVENCNYAVELGKRLKFPIDRITGQDISDGNPVSTMVLNKNSALMWQLMKAYTLSLLPKLANSDDPIDEKEIIQWSNDKLKAAGKQSRIGGFQDSSVANGKVLIDLIDSMKPGVINYENVKDSETPEANLANAKYAVSMARKIGARIYALPEDIVELKSKRVKTVFACLMAVRV